MKWILVLMFSLGGLAHAEVLTSAPEIQFTGGEAYSCRILRHRVKDRWKANASKLELIQSIEKGGWTPARLQRLSAVLGKTGYFPADIFQKSVRVSVSWRLDEIWASILNSDTDLAIEGSFKHLEWRDPAGILPNEFTSRWLAAESRLEMSVMLSPLELCYGSPSLQIALGEGLLWLKSEVIWP